VTKVFKNKVLRDYLALRNSNEKLGYKMSSCISQI